MVSSAVQDQINRILSGRPPNPNQSTLNQAIDFINENPNLRRIAEGGSPTGLTEERQQAFAQQQQETASLSPAERERLQALGQIAQAGTPPQTVQPTATEEALGISLPAEIRDLTVEQARIFVETGQAPQSIVQTFEKRVIDQTESGIPITAFFDVDTGERASLEQQTQLQKRVEAGREAVISSEGRGFVKRATEPAVFGAGQLFEQVKSFPLTETEKKFLGEASSGAGLGLEIVTLPFTTFAKPVSENLQTINLGDSGVATVTETALGGIGTIIPTTPEETAFVIGAGGLLGKAPAIIRGGAGLVFGTAGTVGAFSSDLSAQERVGAGIVGGLGFAGATFEFFPFIKGGFAKFSPEFKGVSTQAEGFKAVGSGEEAIGLILPKSPFKTGLTSDVNLPPTSPLVRGGFGVGGFEKKIFLGEGQKLATSQIGFFKQGETIKLSREFFTTPQEPTLKIAEARLSRLGLVTGLFEFPKDTSFGIGLPKSAQIGVTLGDVTASGKGGSFKIGGGSELEAILGAGGVVSDVRKFGVTTIKGQEVELFEFKTTGGKIGEVGKIDSGGIIKVKSPSTEGLTRISGEVVTSTIGITRFSTTTIRSFTGKSTISTPSTSIISSRKLSNAIKTPSLSISTPKISTGKTVPSRPITLPRLVTTPTITPSTKSIPLRLPIITGGERTKTPRLKLGSGIIKTPKRFTVEVRRGGIFRPVATTKDLNRALNIGRERVATTLGATFRVRGAGVQLKTPQGFRRKGELFIEKRGLRLSRLGEVKEIQRAKKRKKGGKKK